MLEISKKFSPLHYQNVLKPRRTAGAKMVVVSGSHFCPGHAPGFYGILIV